MLKFVAKRRWLYAAAALVIVIAATVVWKALPFGPRFAVVLGAITLVGGFSALAVVRMLAAMREVFKYVAELKEQNAALKASFAVDGENLRVRLALVERRLSTLAIKLDVIDEFDAPKI